MPRGTQRQRRPADVISTVVYVMKVAAGAMVRNKALAPERRAVIARVVAAAR